VYWLTPAGGNAGAGALYFGGIFPPNRRSHTPSRPPPIPIGAALAVSVETRIGQKQVAPAKRGPAPKLQQQMERIQRLPRAKQRFVMDDRYRSGPAGPLSTMAKNTRAALVPGEHIARSILVLRNRPAVATLTARRLSARAHGPADSVAHQRVPVFRSDDVDADILGTQPRAFCGMFSFPSLEAGLGF
jgi:hypothetical protein